MLLEMTKARMFDQPIETPALATWLRRMRLARYFPGWTLTEIDSLNGEDMLFIHAILQADETLR